MSSVKAISSTAALCATVAASLVPTSSIGGVMSITDKARVSLSYPRSKSGEAHEGQRRGATLRSLRARNAFASGIRTQPGPERPGFPVSSPLATSESLRSGRAAVPRLCSRSIFPARS